MSKENDASTQQLTVENGRADPSRVEGTPRSPGRPARIPKRPQPYRPSARDPQGRFAVGNPGGPGRRAGLLKYLSEMTGDGRELIDHALATLRGSVELVDPVTGEVRVERSSLRDQSEARSFLADRGLLPMVKREEVSVEKAGAGRDALDLSALSIEEKRTMWELISKVPDAPALAEGAGETEPEPDDAVPEVYDRDSDD
jgi:hypothetical protein